MKMLSMSVAEADKLVRKWARSALEEMKYTRSEPPPFMFAQKVPTMELVSNEESAMFELRALQRYKLGRQAVQAAEESDDEFLASPYLPVHSESSEKQLAVSSVPIDEKASGTTEDEDESSNAALHPPIVKQTPSGGPTYEETSEKFEALPKKRKHQDASSDSPPTKRTKTWKSTPISSAKASILLLGDANVKSISEKLKSVIFGCAGPCKESLEREMALTFTNRFLKYLNNSNESFDATGLICGKKNFHSKLKLQLETNMNAFMSKAAAADRNPVHLMPTLMKIIEEASFCVPWAE